MKKVPLKYEGRELFFWHCAACDVLTGMPQRLSENFRKNHTIFYCVNGHVQLYAGEK